MKRVNIKLFMIGIIVASFMVFVQVASAKKGMTSAPIWNVPGDFATIQEAIDAEDVLDGDTILVNAGYHVGATVTKAVQIKGIGRAVINSGPNVVGPFLVGLFFDGSGDGSGATISHLHFDTVEFPVFSRGAEDVTATHCTMVNPIQGITNWHGSGWKISHNEIFNLRTYNGGGIGILLGGRNGEIFNNNLVSYNKIIGILHVDENDGGGYNGTGIVLYADFRWGLPGAEEIAYNSVIKNKISLESDTPDVVDVCAIELTDTRNDVEADPYPVIFENAIIFNDLRGTDLQIVLTPEDLENWNYISRNLGKNRGQGLHPSYIRPWQ